MNSFMVKVSRSRWLHLLVLGSFFLASEAMAEHPRKAPVAPKKSQAAPKKVHRHGPALSPAEKAMLERTLTAGRRVRRATKVKILPEIGLRLDTSLAWFSGEPGAGQLGHHDPLVNGFNFNQLELVLGGSVDPYFKLRTFILFGVAGIELEEAVAQTTSLPGGLMLRAGLFKHRLGRINAQHPHSWAFLDRPLVMGKFFGESGSSGLGMELSWLMPVPWYSELIASATVLGVGAGIRTFQMEGDDHADAPEADGHEGHAHGSSPSIDHPGDLLYTLAWKNFHTLGADWGLKWGVSASFGPNGAHRAEIYGVDLHLRYRPQASRRGAALTLQSEILVRRRHDEYVFLGIERTITDWGGYTQLVWQIEKRWDIGLRYGFGSGAEDDPLDPEWDAFRHKGSLEVTFFPSHFSRLRLQANVHNMGHPSSDHAADGHDGEEGHSTLGFSVFLALGVSIGAHPAHSY